MKHTKYLIALALIVSTVANSTVFALSVTEAVNSMQWPVPAELPSVSNPRGNIGYILSNIFYGSSDGALNGKIKSQYLDLSGISGASSVWTASGGTAYYTGAANIATGLTVTSGGVNLPANTIDSTEIADGSILFADWNQNGCTNNQVPKWSSGSGAWVCSTDAGLSGETDPLWTTQSGAYVKKTDYASTSTNGVLTSTDWNIFNSKTSSSGATTNMLPKFTLGGVLINSLIYDDGTKIGIGTNSPTQRLDVNGNIIVEGSGSLFFRDANNGMNSPSTNQLAFNTNGIGRMIIDTTGYVGIGTTAPSEMLEVNGNIKLSGASASYRVTNVASPIGDYDAANKVYVDTKVSAAGSGSPTSQYLSDGSYYSEGGSPYFCRLNVLSGTSQRIVPVNQNKLCNATSSLYCNAGSCNADATTLNNIKNTNQLVAAKDNQSCSITDGQVYCWGYTGNGQKYLDFSLSQTNESGSSFSCTVIANGQVKCWGAGGYGQLGYGSTSNQSAPVAVTGISNAIKVVTSSAPKGTPYARACALLATGQIKCWGYLGGSYVTPQLVSGVSNAIDISISHDQSGGLAHYCALLTTGSVMCAGDNTYGQLGNGTTTSTTFLAPVTVSGISTATKIYTMNGYSMSYAMSCAVLTDGSLKCWGHRNTAGRFWDGYNITAGAMTTPVGQAGIKTSTGVALSGVSNSAAVGYGHNCEVETDGTIKCWGYNANGQLGNGTTISNPTPLTVSGITNAVKVFVASADGVAASTYGRTCALLSDATVKCWGAVFGADVTTPTLISGLTWVTDFSMSPGNVGGYAYWCAVLTGGTIRCAGAGGSYQLGNGSNANSPFMASWVLVTGVTNAVKVYTMMPGTSSTEGRTCALLSDATVKCWGDLGSSGNATSAIAIGSLANVTDFSLSPMLNNTSTDGFYCAVISGGTVKCGGANSYGQLGDWTTTSVSFASAAVSVSGVTNASKIYTTGSMFGSVAYGRACALLSDGTVKCWGYLDGATQSTPVSLSGITGAVNMALSVTSDAGTGHYCVYQSNSSVMCGGSGTEGQLGNSASTDTLWTAPVVVTGITNAIGVYVSSTGNSPIRSAMSCALLADGLIKCWGSDLSAGRMGDGTVGNVKNYPVNVASPVVNAVDLSLSQINGGTSNGHSCAVQANGIVKCWGYGMQGQLGNGSLLTSLAPVTVLGITNAVKVYTANTASSTDSGRSCALLADGTIKCWGYLPGNGIVPTPTAITGIANAIDFSMTQDNAQGSFSGHYCAVLSTGSVVCGGAGSDGQLGNGLATSTYWLSAPIATSGITNAVKILVTGTAGGGWTSSNFGMSCALLSDGLIKCWGFDSGSFGRIGDGSIGTRNAPVSVYSINGMYYLGIGITTVDKQTPTVKEGFSAATNIAVGSYHACAIEGGTVKCWGNNAEGQLGNNSSISTTVPASVFGISNATQIAAGYMHSCAILTDKTVKCWGLNTEGQLGNGTTTSSLTPVPVVGITNAAQISAGDYNTCVTLDTGAVQCWGFNTKGQLGQWSISANYSAVPVTVSGVSGAVRIALGDAYACVVTSSGSTYCWGENKWGQIGNGMYSSYAATPYLVPGITTAARVGAGSNHTCVVLADATMKCWGLNASAQQASTGYYATSTPASLIGMSNILAMAGGMSHTCTISTDLGSSNCFGLNRNGQLGNGTTASSSNPALLTYPSSNGYDNTIYQVSLCETRDTYTGNLGGVDGANSICVAQCGRGYKMARESEMANFKNSATAQNTYWIDRSQTNNCSDWTDSSAWVSGAITGFMLNTSYYTNYTIGTAAAACNLTKQLICVRGIR